MKAAEYVHLTERLAILRRDDRGGVFHLRAKLIGRAGYVYRTTDKTDLEAAKLEEAERDRVVWLAEQVEENLFLLRGAQSS